MNKRFRITDVAALREPRPPQQFERIVVGIEEQYRQAYGVESLSTADLEALDNLTYEQVAAVRVIRLCVLLHEKHTTMTDKERSHAIDSMLLYHLEVLKSRQS